MSYIRDVIIKHIIALDKYKTGQWNKAEAPPENTFTTSELYSVGNSIASEIESTICDGALKEFVCQKNA